MGIYALALFSDAGAGEPVVLTEEQAKAWQEKHGLTKPAESGRIDYARIIDSMFYADDYEYQTYTKGVA